jgi:2-oxoglutarate ferredoxin oxidoreductase subunit alpha
VEITIRLAGEAGDGVILAGEILTYTVARMGLKVFTFRTYPSSVRGGPCMYQLRTSDYHAYSQGDSPDILVAFDTEAISSHVRDLKPNGTLIFDKDRTPDTYSALPKRSFGAPFTTIAKNQARLPKVRNMVIVGYTAGYLGIQEGVLREVVTRRLSSRGEELLQRNLTAVGLGFKSAPKRSVEPLPKTPTKKLVISGNEAIVLGAIAAGCRFYGGYPITPAGDILEEMASLLPAFGGTMFQGEDEIASVGAAIGASFAGIKSMTATSGPGLSLMTEMIGLSSMAEIPLVIVDAQRGGPSTGLPTKTEQSDLNHALYAGHGEAPRIVLAPGDVADCFHQTVRAFNLAERYQMPVILLTDQSLAHRTEGMVPPDFASLRIVNRDTPQTSPATSIRRYAITHDGISPMPKPGQAGGEYIAESVEHDEVSRPNYRPNVHSEMTAKRHRKLETAEKELADELMNFLELPDPKAKLGVVGWGSTQGAIHDAVRRARDESMRVRWLQCKLLNPLPRRHLAKFLAGLETVLVPELNYTSQFANLLRMNFQIDPVTLNKSEGLPFTPNEVFRKIEEVA